MGEFRGYDVAGVIGGYIGTYPAGSTNVYLVVAVGIVDVTEGRGPAPDVFLHVTLIVVGSSILHNFSFVASTLKKVSTGTVTTGISVVEFARDVYIAIDNDSMPGGTPGGALTGTAALVID